MIKIGIATIFSALVLLSSSTSLSKVHDLDTPESIQNVLQSNEPVVVMYYAPWCKACKKFESTYHKLSVMLPKVSFVRINVDNFLIKEHADRVSFIPTVYAARSGTELRNNPCVVAEKDRNVTFVKNEIKKCLGLGK